MTYFNVMRSKAIQKKQNDWISWLTRDARVQTCPTGLQHRGPREFASTRHWLKPIFCRVFVISLAAARDNAFTLRFFLISSPFLILGRSSKILNM